MIVNAETSGFPEENNIKLQELIIKIQCVSHFVPLRQFIEVSLISLF